MSFYDNLKSACTNKGLILSPFIEELGLKSSNTGAWKRGGYPRVENLIEIADALDVSTDYLLGRENKKTESTLLAYSGNEKVDSIIKTLLNSSIDDDDLKIIEVVLDKYKK